MLTCFNFNYNRYFFPPVSPEVLSPFFLSSFILCNAILQNEELLEKYVSKGLSIPRSEALDECERMVLKYKLVDNIAGEEHFLL